MSNHKELIEGLEQASKKQERELVLEFAADRILHYVGVYLVIALSVIGKVSLIAGENLSCFPSSNIEDYGGDFIKYSTSYCWESSELRIPTVSRCNGTVDNYNLLEKPSLVKAFFQWMPYVLLLQAFLFALPTAWWHYKVGARLMGHLKFMQILLNDIYESFKKIPVGNDQGEAYDPKSYYLDGRCGYEPEYKQDGSPSDRIVGNEPELGNWSSLRKRCTGKKRETTSEDGAENIQLNVSEVRANTGTHAPQQNANTCLDFFGPLLDRHFFSMLCFENFAPLQHHPYILSIYRLTYRDSSVIQRGVRAMKQGILRQICHKENFTGRFLVRAYVFKQAIGILLAVCWCIAAIVILFTLGSNSWHAESFECDVVYHEGACVICTMLRKRDVFALFAVDVVVIFTYLLLSSMQWLYMRRSKYRASCFYFEDMDDACSAAFAAAHEAEERARNV